MKQYIIIRNDKKIPIGKIIAHAGHNVLNSHLMYTFNDKISTKQQDWFNYDSQKKIVVSASLKEIKDILYKAAKQGIQHSMVDDVKYGYPICGVVGPVSEDELYYLGLDELPLYKG